MKMEVKKKNRERGDNWTQEEKDLFIEVMRESASVIENKQTDTNTNKKKIAEWINIQSKLRELTGKQRDIAQLKGFWRRTKMTAKKNVSDHKKAIRLTGGGLPPPPPPENDLKIMEICPTDFIIDQNEFDSDGISKKIDHLEVNKDEADQGDKVIYDIELQEIDHNEAETSLLDEVITVPDIHNNEVHIETQNSTYRNTKQQNNKRYKKQTRNESSHKGMIVSSNINLKKRSLQMMEEEHVLKIKYHTQETIHQELRHKMEIDVLLLQKNNLLLEQKKKELKIKLLEKQLQ